MAFIGMVHPTLEYASSVCGTHILMQTNIHSIEMIKDMVLSGLHQTMIGIVM